MTETPALTLSICTYADERFELLQDAIESILDQRDVDLHLLIVVDHNEHLRSRLARERPGLRIVESRFPKGLSGAKNTAAAECTTPLLGFIDDDGSLSPCWARRLLDILGDPGVFGAGSAVRPRWEGERPPWLIPEFDWVIGCSYRGLPTTKAGVRNLSGGACILRLEAIRMAGGFRSDLGRVGANPFGCEETDLFLRLHELLPAGLAVYEPEVEMRHFIPLTRCTWSYFIRRCYSEGVSKALVAMLHSGGGALGTERRHVARVLPLAVARELRAGNALGAVAAVLGTLAAILGYGRGTVRLRHRRLKAVEPTTLAHA